MASQQLGVVLFLCSLTSAQQAPVDLNTEGDRFILYFTEGSLTAFPERPLHIYLSTNSATAVTVSITTPVWQHTDSVNETVVVTSETPRTVPVPPSVRSTEIGRESKAILVEANGLISVFGLNPSQTQAGLFNVLPVTSLGTEYIFPSFTGFNIPSIGFLGIVTEHDQTWVEVQLPTATSTSNKMATIRGIAYGPGSVIRGTLSKYETTEIRQDPNCPKCDLSGSRITSNNPIAIFSTVTLSSPLTADNGGDILIEQVVPLAFWGRTYITMPAPHDILGNVIRVMAGESKVTVYQSDMETFTLNTTGQYKDILLRSNEYLFLQGDGKLQVIQYSPTAPFMLVVTPVEHFTNNAQVPTVFKEPTSTDQHQHSLVILASVCDSERIFVNDTLVSQLTRWISIGTTDFAMAILDVKGSSFHRIRGDGGSDVQFGGYVYGMGDITAYATALSCGGTKKVQTYSWAQPSTVTLHEANLANTDGIRQQTWKLIERDVVSSRQPLKKLTVTSPIACFTECFKLTNCEYVLLNTDINQKLTCWLFDNKMMCHIRNSHPGAKVYASTSPHY